MRIRIVASLLLLPALMVFAVGCGGGGGGGGGGQPAAPTALVVTSTSTAAQLSLTWADVPGATLYKVYRSTMPDIAAQLASTTLDSYVARGTRTAPFVIDGLDDGVPYYFAVAAMNGAGEGPLSVERSGIPLVYAPGGLKVVGKPTELLVSWQPVAGAISYEVYLASEDTLTSATWSGLADADRQERDAPGATFTGLENGKTYYVVVTAQGVAGVSADSQRAAGKPDGRGTFAALDAVLAATGPAGIATATLDGGAVLDLAVVDASTDELLVYLGTGDGAFAAPTAYPTGASPSAVYAGDVTGDGYADLLTANAGDGTMSLFAGDGSGSFASRVDYVVGGVPATITAGSFNPNADALVDIVVGDQLNSQLTVFFADGFGSFAPGLPITTDLGPVFLQAADLDNDGDLDLVTANAAAGTVSALLADGSGDFPVRFESSAGAAPIGLDAHDFDGDGFVDLVVACSSGCNVWLLHGLGDGTFVPSGSLDLTANPAAIASDDYNGDGVLDLVVANGAAGAVTVFVGDGQGGFTKLPDAVSGAHPGAIAVGDFNGDGVLDLAVTDFASGTVTILLGSPV